MSRIYSIIIAAALIGNMALCLPYHPVSSSFYKHPAIESLREKMLDNYLKINNMVGFNEIPNRIIGGVAAAKGEAPFLTQLYRKFVFSYQFLCGGSLITSRTVLSAAHCVSMYVLFVLFVVDCCFVPNKKFNTFPRIFPHLIPSLIPN